MLVSKLSSSKLPVLEHYNFPCSDSSKKNNFGYITATNMKIERVYKLIFGSVYPHYLKKAETKGRSKEELDTVICWLTGYRPKQLQQQIDKKVDMETFFAEAKLHPNASKITGVICGYRVEEIEDPLMKKIRYMDKLIDELAKGKAMEKILRQ